MFPRTRLSSMRILFTASHTYKEDAQHRVDHPAIAYYLCQRSTNTLNDLAGSNQSGEVWRISIRVVSKFAFTHVYITDLAVKIWMIS